MTTLYDYPILHSPTISLGTFTSVLVNAKSPAAAEATGMYDAALQYGVDPAVLLAVFQHESSFGKSGIAVGRDNGFGLRFYGADAFGGTNKSGWYDFPTWTAGAQHFAQLIAGKSYGASTTHSTVLTFPSRYAPSSDGNNPASYGASISRSIATWSGTKGTPVDSSTISSGATSARKTTTSPIASSVGTSSPAATTASVGVAPAAPVAYHVPGAAFGIVGIVFALLVFVIILGSA